MGVGSQQYNQKISLFTKFAYNKMIMKEFIHSVRDEYTKSTLKDIGIQNVVNTACPSMWGLTKEHCSKIPINKSNICVFTLTDYKQKIERDNKLIAVLSKNYEHIYFWPQGFNDWQYFNKLKNIKNVKLISPNLKSYDDFLENTETDFIGTRLHGGIRALQKGKRTLIIGIDNRALELHKDFNIPVIIEENIINLESTICSRIIPSIRIPIENIKTFLNQFNIQN
jgi:polysaccharide pyruvyl transferase WcaK-like protein